METAVALRGHQPYGVENALRSFEEGADYVMMDSPTGSGKSILAAEISRRLGARAFIVTPQVLLAQQYLLDPNVHSILPDSKVVVGRDNFECLRDRLEQDALAMSGHLREPVPVMSVSDAVCYELTPERTVVLREDGQPQPCRYKRWSVGLPECPYYADKARAELASVTVTTLAYFYVATAPYHHRYLPAVDPEADPTPLPDGPKVGWEFGKLSGRPLLIVDEAHGLEDEMVRLLTTRWHARSYGRNTLYEDVWTEWANLPEVVRCLDRTPTDEEAAAMVEGLTGRLGKLLRANKVAPNTDPRAMRFFESLERDLPKMETVGNDLRAGIPWVVRYVTEGVWREKQPVLRLTPVVAAPHLRRALWDRTVRIIVMSGTFLDPKSSSKDLGLDHLQGAVVSLPSEFPASLSPIYCVPVAQLSYQTKETAMPKILEALWRVLEVEKGRGVVHAQSFTNVGLVTEAAPPHLRDRLVFHMNRTPDGEPVSREDIIRAFREESKPGDVLVSPSVTEGLDLPGDKGEFVVFLKCPYASTEDARVVRRREMPDGRDWYDRKALIATIQGRGRTIRSATDSSRTYLLDSAHVSLIDRYRSILPPHFSAALIEGDRALMRDRSLWQWLVAGRRVPA